MVYVIESAAYGVLCVKTRTSEVRVRAFDTTTSECNSGRNYRIQGLSFPYKKLTPYKAISMTLAVYYTYDENFH